MKLNLKYWSLLYSLLFLFVFFFFAEYKKVYSQFLEIHYLDVGQGDASLIITPENQKILIDTGPVGNLNQKFKKYLSFFDKEIDLFILTHPDSDHIGDVFNLLKSFQIKKIALPQNFQNKTNFNLLLKEINRKNIPVLFVKQNNDLQIGQNTFIDFIYPFSNSSIQEQNEFKNSSLVFKIQYGHVSFFFSGDAEKKQEKLIVLSNFNLKSNVYQAGHHGSKSSSNQFFIQNIQPQKTVISSSKDNPFGHPHEEIILRLKKLKSEIYQTSKEGDLSFYTNGKNIWKK